MTLRTDRAKKFGCENCGSMKHLVCFEPKQEKGKKDAQKIDKPALRYLVPEFIQEMGKVLKYGEKKYGPENWKTPPLTSTDFKDAELRHAFSEGPDPDTGCDHEVAVAVNAMFTWWHKKYGAENE